MTLSEERGSFDHETFLFQYQDLLSSTTPCPFLESNLKDKAFQMKIELLQMLSLPTPYWWQISTRLFPFTYMSP